MHAFAQSLGTGRLHRVQTVDQTRHRYMQVEAFSKIDTAEVDPILSITTEAA